MTNEEYIPGRLPEREESALAAAMLVYPGTRQEAARLICEGDFTDPFCGALFAAAMEMDETDTVVLREKLRQRGYVLDEHFVRDLLSIATVPANVGFYAERIRENTRRKKLMQLGTDLQTAAMDGSESAEIISNALDRLGEIDRGFAAAELADPDEAGEIFWKHRERVEDGKGAVPTGFKPLDSLLGGGMLRSGLYILAARPGMGKTTFALQIMDSIAETTGPVLFVSLEMAIEQIQGKRIARLSGIPSDELLLSNGERLDYQKIAEADEKLRKLPVSISRRTAATVAQIRHMAKQVPDLQCVVVDYLGKITASNPKASRYEAITEISGGLKTLAVELGVPVLCLSQLNRENTGRNDKRPQLSDLRDSGAVEQDADGVVMLHRADYYQMSETILQPWESVELEILVRKNRHGRVGSCRAGFFPATGKIVRSLRQTARAGA